MAFRGEIKLKPRLLAHIGFPSIPMSIASDALGLSTVLMHELKAKSTTQSQPSLLVIITFNEIRVK